MRKDAWVIMTALLGVTAGCAGQPSEAPVQGQAAQPSFAAVPGQIGGQDLYGAYEPVPDWPKPLSELPGNEKWTWGAGQGIFAESPDRVYVLQRGQLPNLGRPKPVKLPQLGPSIEFPIGRLPWRDATSASPPGRLEKSPGVPGDDLDVGVPGVDYDWENCLLVVNRNGDIIERWTQWDKMFRRPHSVYVSPYDPEKRVWVVDDYRHAIFIFSNDGKQLLQTIGVPNEHASDDKHFYRPTFIAWLPDGTFFVADGYANTRVVKFDKDGKYLMAWGEPGDSGKETRPGYFNNVHGVAVDVETRQVFVNDRANHRVQVFDENGKFLREWKFGDPPSDVHLFIIPADRSLWAFDRASTHMMKYDLEGHFQYAWGAWGDFPGSFWGVHGMSVDQEGNLYVAEVDHGGFQKFRPRAGANPAFLIGAPVTPVWQ
jgi:sugar lactone lactonase YvrE